MNNFAGWNKEQLLAANTQILEQLRAINAEEKARAIRGISVGDKMFFTSNKTGKVNCTVIKVLRTNVDVVTDAGRPWRVPANMLQFRD